MFCYFSFPCASVYFTLFKTRYENMSKKCMLRLNFPLLFLTRRQKFDEEKIPKKMRKELLKVKFISVNKFIEINWSRMFRGGIQTSSAKKWTNNSIAVSLSIYFWKPEVASKQRWLFVFISNSLSLPFIHILVSWEILLIWQSLWINISSPVILIKQRRCDDATLLCSRARTWYSRMMTKFIPKD